MKQLTVEKVAEEMLGLFDAKVLQACRDNKHFDDYCKIGALLTDEGACKKHLLALNKALKVAAPQGVKNANVTLLNEQKGQVKSKPDSVEAIYKEFVDWSQKDENKTYHKKFSGLLASVLQKREDRWGFNGAAVAPEPVVAGRTATLTGFVQPEHFKTLLLTQAVHWKDPGARLTHGEFTHRIQWWIIMSEGETPTDAKYTLANSFTALYRSLPLYAMNTNDGKVMWDFLFDCFGNAPPQSDAFRTPDVLHSYLLNGAFPLLDLLGSVIRARQNKRLFMENRIVDGSAYEAYISWKMAGKKQYDEKNIKERIVYKKA